MLEGLDKINWSQLHHAYGEASDVPILIRKLLSQDQNERDEVLEDLFSNIWHQGTIWEASSYVIPFLWELIKSPETPDKLQIVFLLASLAIGKHAYYGKLEDGRTRQKWTDILEKNGKVLKDEFEKGQTYESSIRLEVAKEFQLLYPYLFCDLYVIRDHVAKVFGEYPEFKSETLPLLKQALASENDEYARKSIENSIKILSKLE